MDDNTAQRCEAFLREIQSGVIAPISQNLFTGKYHRRVTRNGFIRLPRDWLPRWSAKVVFLAGEIRAHLPAIATSTQWRVGVISGPKEAVIILEPEESADRGDRERGFGEWLPQSYCCVVTAKRGQFQLPARALEALGAETSEVVLCGLMSNIRVFSPGSWRRCEAELAKMIEESD